ncbi:hypothetical protein EDB81DRAFT_917125, partial [Dactylonectria macrodidyma]
NPFPTFVPNCHRYCTLLFTGIFCLWTLFFLFFRLKSRHSCTSGTNPSGRIAPAAKMMPTPCSLRSVTGLARAIFVFGFIARAVQALDIVVPDLSPILDTPKFLVSDIFVVKPGTEKGGCDAYDVNQWYQDAVTLVTSAKEAVAAAVSAGESGDTKADSLKYLQTFFDVRPLKTAQTEFTDRTAKMTGKFSETMNQNPSKALTFCPENIQDVIDALVDDSEGDVDDKPWIFCDSTWTVEEAWDDTARATAKEPNPDGKPIREVYKDWYQPNYVDRKAAIDAATTQEDKDALIQPFFPFWSDDFKAYIFDVTGDYCSRTGNFAGTDDNFQPNSMTFCAKNFNSDHYAKLDDLPAVTKGRVSIKDLEVTGLTFLHETFHFALLNEHTPDLAYLLTEITKKKPLDLTGEIMTADESIRNPESYTLFALAYHLGKLNPDYTFASGMSYKPR